MYKIVNLRTSIVTITTIGGSVLCNGQTNITPGDITAVSTSIGSRIPTGTTGNPRLVTPFTFRRIFSSDYAKILIGENTIGSGTPYATLKVDKDKSSVSFAPYVFFIRNPEQHVVHLFGNVSFKGEVNSNEISTLFNKDGFTKNYEVAFNGNWLIGGGGFYNYNLSRSQFSAFRLQQNRVLTQVTRDYQDLLAGTSANILKNLANRKALRSVAALRKSMWKTFSEYEEQLAEPEWTRKVKYWIGFSLRTGHKTENVYNTKTKQVETIDYRNTSFAINPNILVNLLQRKLSLYGSISLEYSNKNSFTGKSASSWNKITQLGDTSMFITEQKDVYMYNDDTFKKELLPTAGIQGVVIWENSKFPIGVDILFKTDWLVQEPNKNRARKYIQSYGLVFPFNNKNGERAINIELFYSHNTFSNKEIENDEFWGAKFAVPIFSR